MMEDASSSAVVARLIQASGAKNASELADILGVTAQAISHAKRKEQIPPAWVFAIAGNFRVATDWLLFGRGFMCENTRCSTEEKAVYETRIAELERRLREKDETISVLTAAVKQANAQGMFEPPAGTPQYGTPDTSANESASQCDQAPKK